MSEIDVEHPRLRDPLSIVTRKQRQLLLLASLLGLTLVKTGIVPSKISGLGIEFQSADQRAILLIVALIVSYFLVAFTIYAASDFLAWKVSISKQVIEKTIADYEEDLRNDVSEPEIDEYRYEMYEKIEIYIKLITPTSIFRAFFDFALPIFFGGYSLFLLVR